MPRFNIPDQRVTLQPAQADAQAFGAGVGQAMQSIGEGIGSIAKVVKEKRDRNDRLQLGIDMTEAVSQLESDNEALKEDHPDGAGYSDAVFNNWDEKTRKFLDEVDPSYRLEAESKLADMRARLAPSVRKTQAALVANNVKVRVAEQIDRSSNAILRTGNYDLEIAKLNMVIDGLPEDQKQAVRQDVQDKLLEAKFKHSIQAYGYQKTLKDYENRVYDDMPSDVAESALRSAKIEQTSKLKSLLSSSVSQVARGQQVLDDLYSAADEARAMGEPELAEKLTNVAKVEDISYSAVTESSTQRSDRLKELSGKSRGAGLTDQESLEYQAVANVEKEFQSAKANGELWDWFTSTGYIPQDLPSLQLLPIEGKKIDMESFKDSVNVRQEYRRNIMIDHGVDPGLLSNQEIASIQGALKGAGPEFYADYLHMITTGFGPDNLASVVSQIAPKDDRLQGLMAISLHDPETVAKIKAGWETPANIPNDSEIIQKMQALGYHTSGMDSESLNQLLMHTKGLLSSMSRDGKTDINSRVDEALKILVPEPYRAPNGTTAVPLRRSTGEVIPAKDQQRALRKISAEDFKRLGIKLPQSMGRNIEIEDMMEYAQLVPLDDYNFLIRKRGTQEFFYNEDGPIEINMEKLIDSTSTEKAVPFQIREGVGP
jgi:hypothetical protein